MWRGNKMYECDYCGFTNELDVKDPVHGNLWDCEECARTFCGKCFKERFGEKAFGDMLLGALSGPFDKDILLCPDCFAKKIEKGEITI